MKKYSILEVDFEHLAWTPVDKSISDSIPGAIKPLEMARGRNEVYVKAEWVANSKSQVNEILDYQKIFNEIDGEDGIKDGISAKFIPFVTKDFGKDISPSTEPTNSKKSSKKDKESIDDIIGDMNLDDLEGDTDIDSVEVDDNPELQSVEDIQEYAPETKYNYYVINEADKILDSGWEGIDSAEARLSSIEGNGGEGYSVEKYGTSLLKIIGDPVKVEWNPFNTFNFYVENITTNDIESGHDDNESAKKRIAELKDILAENGDIDVEYEVIKKEKALEKYGLGISFEATWEPINELVSKVTKMRDEALLEAVLTELDNSSIADALGKLYLVFEYSKDYNPTDDSDRVGGAEEYIEREIFLNKIVSEDGSEQVTSKELKKASDKLKIVKPYQRLIKLLNHSASYFYDNLGFAKANEPYSKIKKHMASGYRPTSDEVDESPSAQIANRYIDAISSLKGGQNTFEDTMGQLKNTFSKILGEFIGGIPAKDIVVSDEEFEDEITDNPILAELIDTIRRHYEGARLKHIDREIRNNVVPAIMAIPDEDERNRVYDELMKDLNTHISLEVDEYEKAIKSGKPAPKNADSITPFTINQNDPGVKAKHAKQGKTLPRKGEYGIAGIPVLYDPNVKEYQRKVNEATKALSSERAFNKLGSNYKAKSQMVDAKYQELFGTSRKDDYKALAMSLKDRNKGGSGDYR